MDHPELLDRVLVVAALAAIVLGAALHLTSRPGPGDVAWAAGTIVVLMPLACSVARALWRRRLGVDLIALLAMAAALAAGEYLAAVVVGLMLAGGNALEAAAGRRAGRELTALVERAPRIAHRRVGAALEEVSVEALEVGDLVVVRARRGGAGGPRAVHLHRRRRRVGPHGGASSDREMYVGLGCALENLLQAAPRRGTEPGSRSCRPWASRCTPRASTRSRGRGGAAPSTRPSPNAAPTGARTGPTLSPRTC